MQCVKTGFCAIVGDFYIRGDAFELDGYGYLFRVCAKTRFNGDTPVLVHFVLSSYEHWFDQFAIRDPHNSTLLVRYKDCQFFDYRGRYLEGLIK